MICGIYKIISPSNKVYIGQSKDIKKRWRDYKYSKTQIRLNRSFEKYGIENHIFEIIEECSLEDLNTKENYYQVYYNVLGENGLNCKITDIKTKKYIFTEESKKKMSLGRMGSKNHRFGKKMTQELKHKILESLKYRVFTEESKLKRKISIGDKQKNGGNPRAKKVICEETGIIFECIKECAEYLKMNRKTLNDQLLGRYKNKTTFRIL
jgi:group I intron endonuclease